MCLYNIWSLLITLYRSKYLDVLILSFYFHVVLQSFDVCDNIFQVSSLLLIISLIHMIIY